MTSRTTTETARLTIRMNADLKASAEYYRRRKNITLQEYILNALEEKIARENGDFDSSSLMIAKLNAVIDGLNALYDNQEQLTDIITETVHAVSRAMHAASWLEEEA